jgi:hypothetical protein
MDQWHLACCMGLDETQSSSRLEVEVVRMAIGAGGAIRCSNRGAKCKHRARSRCSRGAESLDVGSAAQHLKISGAGKYVADPGVRGGDDAARPCVSSATKFSRRFQNKDDEAGRCPLRSAISGIKMEDVDLAPLTMLVEMAA